MLVLIIASGTASAGTDSDAIGGLLVILVVGYIIYQGSIGWKNEAKTVARNKIPKSKFTWPLHGDFAFNIVGESHYQSTLVALAGSIKGDAPEDTFQATIIPEDNNKYDEMAVRIDFSGHTVGYMSRESARQFRHRLIENEIPEAVTTCEAIITGGFELENGTTASYGVRLDLKPFDS